MVKFVVLECQRSTEDRNYARIHTTGCGHAREPNHKTASTLWHGYFDRYYEAMDFAKSLNVDKVYDCEFCHPRHAKETVQEKKEV